MPRNRLLAASFIAALAITAGWITWLGANTALLPANAQSKKAAEAAALKPLQVTYKDPKSLAPIPSDSEEDGSNEDDVLDAKKPAHPRAPKKKTNAIAAADGKNEATRAQLTDKERATAAAKNAPHDPTKSTARHSPAVNSAHPSRPQSMAKSNPTSPDKTKLAASASKPPVPAKTKLAAQPHHDAPQKVQPRQTHAAQHTEKIAKAHAAPQTEKIAKAAAIPHANKMAQAEHPVKPHAPENPNAHKPAVAAKPSSPTKASNHQPVAHAPSKASHIAHEAAGASHPHDPNAAAAHHPAGTQPHTASGEHHEGTGVPHLGVGPHTGLPHLGVGPHHEGTNQPHEASGQPHEPHGKTLTGNGVHALAPEQSQTHGGHFGEHGATTAHQAGRQSPPNAEHMGQHSAAPHEASSHSGTGSHGHDPTPHTSTASPGHSGQQAAATGEKREPAHAKTHTTAAPPRMAKATVEGPAFSTHGVALNPGTEQGAPVTPIHLPSHGDTTKGMMPGALVSKPYRKLMVSPKPHYYAPPPMGTPNGTNPIPHPFRLMPKSVGSHSARGTVPWGPGSPVKPSHGIKTSKTKAPAEPRNVKGHGKIDGGGDGSGLLGAYYNGQNFDRLVLKRPDRNIVFDWTGSRPDMRLPENQAFSVRWLGKIKPRYSELYTFYTASDDGIRLWVDGKEIINNWTIHAPSQDTGQIALEANKRYDIKVEYFEKNGMSQEVMMLYWESPHQIKEYVPESCLFYPKSEGGEVGLMADTPAR